MTQRVTPEEVLDVLVERLRDVLALDDDSGPPGPDPDAGWRAVRFDEDLRADSLDLVEVVEATEAALAGRGAVVALPDSELVTLRTVGDAADRIAGAAASPGG